MAKTSFYSSSGATSTETDAIEGSVNAAAASQAAAATSETNAAASATSAASSASSASSSSSSATTAKTASETAKTASETAKTASEAARDLALTYRDAAAASSSTSTTKANEASTSATAAASSATAAASSASAASSSQSAAASSATSAASSAASLTTEAIQDIVGAMFSSNTEDGASLVYHDSDGTIDFTISTLNQSTSGNASTATALQTARTIHGVSFDGTSNIDLSEVVQDTVGAMFTSTNTETGITATYQDSTGDIDLVIGTLNQDTTGLAGTATALATARTIGGTSFDGTSNIDVALATLATNVVVSDNESSNQDCAITFVNDLDGAASIGLQSDGNLFYNPSTGTLTVPNVSVTGTQTIVDSVTMNASNQVVFEGSSADAHETFLTSINATADRTISLPNVSGTLPVLAAVSDTQITSTPEELNILDGVTSTAAEINLLDGSSANTVVNSKAVIYGSSGELAGALSTAAQPNITSVGTLSSLTVSGDVTVDTNTLKVDSSNNRIGVNNASPDVSLDLGSNTDAVHMPTGNTAARPNSPAAGYFRYNSETAKFEGYTDEWGAIAGSGGSGSAVETQIFVGDGSDVTYTLTTAPANENDLIVMIDGVFQDHSVYSLSGNVLTFATAPSNNRKITVYHFVSAVGGSNHSIATMTGNGSLTTLNLPTAPVHENNTTVTFDGVVQARNTYSVSGTTVTFSEAVPSGVYVECVLAKATNISTATQLVDADSDTLIQCEEGTDDDTIRFDVAGTEVLTIAEGASNTEIKFKGTAPALIIGDAGAEDTKIVFDGNAQDYYIGLDDSADDLVIGKGSAVGTTPAISVDEDLHTTLGGNLILSGTSRVRFDHSIIGDDLFDTDSLGLACDHTESMRFGIENADGSFTERMRMANSGYLYIKDSGNDHYGLVLEADNNDAWIRMGHNGTDGRIHTTYNSSAGATPLYLGTHSHQTAMIIDTSGNVGIGNTASASLNENGFYCMGNGLNTYSVQNGTASSTYHVYDRSTANYKFYLTYSGNIYATNTTVNGISDERLKENIKDLDQGLSDVLKLKPRKFDWKEGEGSGEKNVSGFVAQEAEASGFGEFVGNFKHNTLSDAKSFGQGGLIPVLTKAIQELSAKNDALEARIKTLEDA